MPGKGGLGRDSFAFVHLIFKEFLISAPEVRDLTLDLIVPDSQDLYRETIFPHLLKIKEHSWCL